MKPHSLFTFLALLLAVSLAVPAVSAVTVALSNGEIATVGEETTVYLVLDSAPDGLSGYNIDLTQSNPSVAEITNISFPAWAADMNSNSPYPTGSKKLVKASDVNNRIGAGAKEVVLAAVTVRGLSSGTAAISLSGKNFDDEAGNDIPAVTLVNSVISVNASSGRLPYDAKLAGHTIPVAMPKNRNITVSFTVNNSGRNPWMHSAAGTPGVYLAAVNGSYGDAAKFGFTRMDIPENTAILTGREYTFNYTMRVPNETGSYSPAYQLQSDSAGPFGPVFNSSVAVVNGEPAIRFTAPVDDNYANESVIFNGTVSDPAITSLNIRHNSVSLAPAAVTNGNFSGTVVLNANDELTASAYGGYGFLEEATLWFDGDRLPGDYEQSIGFDPQNPDSDNSLTPQNEANNGIPDGYEKVDGKLPVFVKYRLGANPFVADTDGDGLSDEFELTRLGLTTNVTSADSDNNGITDANEDADSDGLTNLVEQTHGTDPLVADSDGDSLTDADEINRGTNPVSKDTDNDALDDDSEVRLNTNSLNAYSVGPGTMDGNRTFTSTRQFFGSSLELSVTGIGDAVRRASISNVNYTHLIPDTILVSNVSAITFGNDTTSSVVKIHYFPDKVGTPSNLSMFVKNETSGSFDSLPFTLDAGNKIVSSTVTTSGEYCVMDKVLWDARFVGSEQQQMAMKAMAAPVTVSYSASGTSEKSSEKSNSGNSAKSSVTLSTSSNLTSVRKPVFIPDPTVKNSPLVYGIDYGPADPKAIRADKDRWDLNTSSSANPNSKIAAKTTTPLMRSAAAGSGQTWEAVENGDFSQGLVAWMPNTPSYGSDGSVAWEVDTDTSSYTSSPKSLRLRIVRQGSTTTMDGGYEVAHANIDTLHASQLTFRYRYTQAVKDSSISAYRLELLRKTSPTGYAQVWESNRYNSLVVGQWSSPVVITLNPEDSLQTYKFRLYYSANAVQPANIESYATVLIDDVSVISSERPRQPTDANIRFRILNSANGQPITAGTVYVQKATELLQSPVKSDGTTENFLFESPGTYPVEVYSTGYTTLQTTISVTQGQTGTFDLYMGAAPPQTGTLNVYSNPAGAEIFVDGTSYGLAPLTINSIPVGSHTLTAKLADYQDLIQTVTVNSGTSDLPLTLTPKNSDADNITDLEEKQGYKDPCGNIRTSNATLADSDGDGLTDDYEAGDKITDKNGHTFRKMRSDPLKADSDGDGWDDAIEDDLGTDPLNTDSDNDGIPDAEDDDPLVPVHKPSAFELALQPIHEHLWTTQGLIFGEMGIKGGSANGLVGDEAASSGAYFAGWMTSGYGGLGDVRDTAEALYRHDTIGASLNAIGIVPLLGDSEKSLNAARKVVTKYPGKAVELGVYISKQILPYVPDEVVKLDIWDWCFNGAGRRLVQGDVTADNVLTVINRGGKLDETLNVIKRSDGTVVWLQEGKSTWGWQHIKDGHLTDFKNKFGDATTEAGVQEMIFTTIKSPDQVIRYPENKIEYIKTFTDKNGEPCQIMTVVSDRVNGIGKGNIVTAHPFD